MPQADKKDLNLLERLNEAEKEHIALSAKGRKLTKAQKDEKKKLNQEIAALTKTLKGFEEQSNKTIANLIDLQKKTGKLAKEVKQVHGDPKLSKWLGKIADQSKKAGPLLADVSNKIKNLNEVGKGGGDMAKALTGVLKTEEAILSMTSDRSKLMEADIGAQKAAAKETLKRLSIAGDQTKEEQEHVKLQLQQLRTLEKIQTREKTINELKEKQNELTGKLTTIYDKLTSGPLMLVVTLLEAAKMILNKVRLEAVAVNAEMGGSAAFSAKWAINMKAAHGATKALAIEATGLGTNVRDAQMQSAKASDNLELMKNSALGVNDAVAAIQSGLSAEQFAELAQTMADVTDSSREGASEMLNATMALAEANNVAPGAVMADMATNSAELAKMTDGSAENMARLAVAARKAGFELSNMNSMADGLLDIETSLTKEFEASVLLNRDINLDMARQAAMQNDMEGMMGAIQEQLGGMDYASLDRIQREALAEAVGVDENNLGKIMARGGQAELEGTLEEKSLKGIKDLARESLVHTDRLGSIITLLQGIAIAVGMSSLMNIFGKAGIGKFFKGKGAKVPKTPKPVKTGNLSKLNQLDKTKKAGMFSKTLTKAQDFGTGLLNKAGKGKAAVMTAGTTATNWLSKQGTKLLSFGSAAKDSVLKSGGKVTKFVTKNLGKSALKKIPVLGALPAIAFAGMRAMQGDFAGAGLELASGASNLANLVAPGFGSAGSIAIDSLLMARDMGVDVGFAKGGVVPKTGTYMVGEQGPEMVAMSRGSHVVPNNRISGGYAGGTGTDVMASTNERLDTLITLLSKVDTHTSNTAAGVNNINIRTGR